MAQKGRRLNNRLMPGAWSGKCNTACANSSSGTIVDSLYVAIATKDLDVVYQPIIHHETSSFYGNELLSRPKVNGSWIAPDVWFQAAYAEGKSVEADLLALERGMEDFKLLPGELQRLSLFINVLPSSLKDKTFYSRLDKLLTERGYSPSRMILEVTEQVSYNPLQMAELLAPIRELGFRIALDDVGTGSANLESLVRLEPDFIKIDRSLIQGISYSSAQQRMVSHLVGYMGSGDRVIAEGVENLSDLVAIRESGVHLSQGYYWSKPSPPQQISAFLSSFQKKSDSFNERNEEE